jgi:Bacteriophage head to tail connecting protein
MDAKALIALGDNLFQKRGALLSMWQEISDQFYPERADFTLTRSLGDDFAGHLTTSYPLLVRRDLGNSFGAMMRPTSLEWFHMRALREEHEDQPAKAWMEWATGTMRRAMYDRRSLFTRASKEGDHDLATFGQTVKSVEMNRNADGLLYRCWHLRDNAWCENAEGVIDTNHRKWKPTAAGLADLFREKVHSKVSDKLVGPNKNPYAEINCRHIVLPSEMYDGDYLGKKSRQSSQNPPFVSIYIDVDNDHIMEAVGQKHFKYVIPRWQTVSGSQYAYSPATVAALPDARLLQAMTLTLLEAGEKAANPPLVGVQEAIRSDVSVYAGGLTWVDAEYDERLGEVLRPLTSDKSGIPFGVDMHRDIMGMLRECFYLDKLSLPQRSPEMTAYEVSMRVQDYIRQASPIFEPLEHEDNGAICETTFEIMLSQGAFGSFEDIPQSIRGKEIGFRFESPLHDAIERQKGQKFAEARGLLAETLPLDPTASAHLDFRTAFRDTLTSIGIPAKWMKSEEDADKQIEESKAAEQAAQLIESMGAGAQVAEQIGKADQALGPEVLAA